jgi:hypothetical protein
MAVEIKEVKNKKEIIQFVDFQYDLYKDCPYFVPSIRSNVIKAFDKVENPSLEFCDVRLWLAFDNKEIVGRVAGVINHRYNQVKNEKSIRFGWLDYIDDYEIVEKLIAKVEEWGKELGMEKIQGPLGMTNFDPCGMLVEGFDELATSSSIYNFPYYPGHIDRLDYKKEVDWVEYKIMVPDKTPDQLQRIAKIVKEKYNLAVVNPDSKHELLQYGKGIFKLLNEAYHGLYNVIDFDEKQIDYLIKKYLPQIPPRYVCIVLKEKEVVAFGVSVPSISKALQKCKGRLFPFGFIYLLKALKKNTIMDLMLIAVKPELQNKGINSIMFDELTPKYIQDGYIQVETNSELEFNAKVQAQWKFFNPELTKRKRCYSKTLS